MSRAPHSLRYPVPAHSYPSTLALSCRLSTETLAHCRGWTKNNHLDVFWDVKSNRVVAAFFEIALFVVIRRHRNCLRYALFVSVAALQIQAYALQPMQGIPLSSLVRKNAPLTESQQSNGTSGLQNRAFYVNSIFAGTQCALKTRVLRQCFPYNHFGG